MVKRIAAAAERNSAPIFEVLNRILPEGCAVLEVSSGSGQHGAYVTAHRSDVTWQPSDIGDDELASIAAWRAEVRRPNLLAPMKLDARAPKWPVEVAGARFDAVVCINMIHIAPWECCLGLIGGAARILSPGGLLYLYGPYAIHGTFNAPSNEAFDRMLRSRDPLWGVRDLVAVSAEAETAGFRRLEVIDMPANNYSVIFERLPRT